MTDIIKIPTGNLEFSTTANSKETLSSSDRDNWNDNTFWAPTLPLRAVRRCCNRLATLLRSFSSSKIRNLSLEFRRSLSYFQTYNYFRFWQPYRYFRLSIAVAISCQHFSRARRRWKSGICRWNFYICRTFGDISTSGLGSNINIRC